MHGDSPSNLKYQNSYSTDRSCSTVVNNKREHHKLAENNSTLSNITNRRQWFREQKLCDLSLLENAQRRNSHASLEDILSCTRSAEVDKLAAASTRYSSRSLVSGSIGCRRDNHRGYLMLSKSYRAKSMNLCGIARSYCPHKELKLRIASLVFLYFIT